MNILSGETTLSKRLLPLSEKRVYSKRKEFAPLGSKFFPFREGPFSEGTWYAEKQTESQKSYLPCENGK